MSEAPDGGRFAAPGKVSAAASRKAALEAARVEWRRRVMAAGHTEWLLEMARRERHKERCVYQDIIGEPPSGPPKGEHV